MAEHRGGRLGAFARGVVGSTVVGPVREGRIRDHGWPYGLRAVVLLGLPRLRLRRGPRGRLRRDPPLGHARPGRHRHPRAPGAGRVDARDVALLRAQPAADGRAARAVVAAGARAPGGPLRPRRVGSADAIDGRVPRVAAAGAGPARRPRRARRRPVPATLRLVGAGGRPGPSAPPASSSGSSRTATRSPSGRTRCRSSCSTSPRSWATSSCRPPWSPGPRWRRSACG